MKLLQAHILLCGLLISGYAAAEVRTITATGEYRMGDNDTRTDAKRLALLDAKRLALEQAGTYLESVTEVKNRQVSHDELRAYTAGIIEVLEQATTSVMEGQQQVIRVAVTAKIDTAVMAQQIDALLKNETAKGELLRVRREAEQLRQERGVLQQQLAVAKTKPEMEALAQKRQEVLTRLEADDLLRLAWGKLISLGSAPLDADVIIARRLVEAALALDPSHSRTHYTMGYILSRHDKKLEEALYQFREALRIDPKNQQAHIELGLVLHALGDRDKADAEFMEVLRYYEEFWACCQDNKRGSLWAVHQSIGDAFKDMGDVDAAVIHLRAATRLQPDNPVSRIRLGQALAARGDLEGAVAESREVVRLMPDSMLAHYRLGDVLRRKGDLKGAINEHRTALRLEPDCLKGNCHNGLGLALFEAGDYDGAIEAFREAIRLRPGDFAITFNLGKALMKKGDLTESIVQLRTALHQEPDNTIAREYLGTAFYLAGEFNSAIGEFREAIRLEPDEAAYHFGLALSLRDLGNVDGAISELREALRLRPGYEAAQTALRKISEKRPE